MNTNNYENIYHIIYRNYESIINNDQIKQYLTEQNNLIVILRNQNKNLSNKEIDCQALTVLCFILHGSYD